MANCCHASRPATPEKHVCPVNGKPYHEVPFRTVLHHIKQPWNQSLTEQPYYFCDDPECDVVYFGLDNAIINKDSLRMKVGVKEHSDQSTICYCFGINRQQAKDTPRAKAFVVEQTRTRICSCTTSNPSGRCCLKDFPE